MSGQGTYLPTYLPRYLVGDAEFAVGYLHARYVPIGLPPLPRYLSTFSLCRLPRVDIPHTDEATLAKYLDIGSP